MDIIILGNNTPPPPKPLAASNVAGSTAAILAQLANIVELALDNDEDTNLIKPSKRIKKKANVPAAPVPSDTFQPAPKMADLSSFFAGLTGVELDLEGAEETDEERYAKPVPIYCYDIEWMEGYTLPITSEGQVPEVLPMEMVIMMPHPNESMGWGAMSIRVRDTLAKMHPKATLSTFRWTIRPR